MSGRCPQILLKPRPSPHDEHDASDAEGMEPMTRKGGSAAAGHLPSMHAALGRWGTEAKLATPLHSCRFLPPPPPPQPSWPTLPFRATPTKPARKNTRGRLLNGRMQVAAYRTPRGLQRGGCCCLARGKPFQGAFRLCPCGMSKAEEEQEGGGCAEEEEKPKSSTLSSPGDHQGPTSSLPATRGLRVCPPFSRRAVPLALQLPEERLRCSASKSNK